jgi:hypothetical protein
LLAIDNFSQHIFNSCIERQVVLIWIYASETIPVTMLEKNMKGIAFSALLSVPVIFGACFTANALTNELVSGVLRESSITEATTIARSVSSISGELRYNDKVRTADYRGYKEVVGYEKYSSSTVTDTKATTKATSVFDGSLIRVIVRY